MLGSFAEHSRIRFEEPAPGPLQSALILRPWRRLGGPLRHVCLSQPGIMGGQKFAVEQYASTFFDGPGARQFALVRGRDIAR